ncbi:IDEAL domain-containing protein [Alicyclobacillus tolerans]|uniref:IDEAL domain-containing protein n=1 Tax=Alicyclobacillus tolerans TaxID=90970 RepID=UPI001F3CFB14|nr:IDEAL domain-containing protein [Alicyclobacillus tolerans]MCF8564506.1 IDEAL domain-containing protein [Alicyclobacillus tolerans]
MIAKEEILLLKTKILPAGADVILDFLASRHDQVELTHIVLENVPLLIIGRHGMIARVPVNGTLKKVSQLQEIMDLLNGFFQKQEKLYLFVNLPDLPLPQEVTRVLEEVQERAARKDQLRRIIDQALETGDRETFYEASGELKRMLAVESMDASKNKHQRF